MWNLAGQGREKVFQENCPVTSEGYGAVHVEAVGIEPTSESLWKYDTTCVFRVLI